MDYKEKYEQALEVAQRFYNNSVAITKKGLEDIFPELAESEDERVRKEIISYLKRRLKMDSSIPVAIGYWIDWFEKQGEQKPNTKVDLTTKSYITPNSEFFQWIYDRLVYVHHENPDVDYMRSLKERIEDMQKPIDKIQLGKKYKCVASPRYSTFMIGKIYKPEDKFLCSLMNFCSDCFEPIEDGEQKPADKAEPKFKEGDYIKSTISGISYYITGVSNDYYMTDTGCIIMFNAQDNFELSKQEPAWSEEDEMFVHGLIRGLAAKRDIHGHTTFSSDCIDITKTIDWLKSLKERVQPKPAEWSEEDMSMIGNIRSIIEKYAFSQSAVDVNGELCEQEYIDADNWLKSLKDRVQPKQEWSDVDKDILFRTIDNLKFLRNTISIDPKYAVNIIDIERGITWLKSLRPQNTWKPSDEQMLAISTAINVVGKGTINGKYLIELQEQLKKLREK